MDKALENKSKLPPTRLIAQDLEVSRSTVVKAYDLLVIEKYIKSIKGSGYYVSFNKVKKPILNSTTNSKIGGYPIISKRGKSFRKNVLSLQSFKVKTGVAFRPGLPPLDIFPIAHWKNLSNEYWKNIKSSELTYSNPLGEESLRQNIANYLKIYRNINCNLNQVIITTGSLHSLSLIADVLIDKGDEVIIENPSYQHAFHLFDSLKARLCYVGLDKEGININNIKCKTPKLIYTTPSNQYPTGIKMSLKRRIELLHWASNKNTFIVEDDYDHEFSNWEYSVPSIYSLDKQDRVIYLGTFNKLLHPAIRIGYMIVPNYLLDTITAFLNQSSRFVSPPLQKTLSKFIERDYLNKHLREVLKVSTERKKLFYDFFNLHFKNEIYLNPNNSGLHIIGDLKKGIDDKLLSSHFFKKGIVTYPYSNYFIGNKKNNGLVMGYCSVNNKVIKETIVKMKNEYDNFLKNLNFK